MKILVAGDFYPDLRLKKAILQQPEMVLGYFNTHIQKTDLAIVNLETPLTTNSIPIKKTGPALKADESSAMFLKQAGFKLVTLANNHILDYGTKGLADTLNTLNKIELSHVGAGLNHTEASKPFFFTSNRKKLTVLNFAENEWTTTHNENPGANPLDLIGNFKSIQVAKTQSDYALVIVHGGHELYRLPSPRIKQLYRFFVDAGADAVIGHHPHFTSGYEIYNNAPIFYSLGNFLFDHQKYRNSCWNQGMAIELEFGSQIQTNFKIIHFNQCNENPDLMPCSLEEEVVRNEELALLNQIILDDSLLQIEFQAWAKKNTKMYKAYIEPRSNQYLTALQNRGWLPSFWSMRKKRYLLNLVRCESHQEILITILKNELNCHT